MCCLNISLLNIILNNETFHMKCPFPSITKLTISSCLCNHNLTYSMLIMVRVKKPLFTIKKKQGQIYHCLYFYVLLYLIYLINFYSLGVFILILYLFIYITYSLFLYHCSAHVYIYTGKLFIVFCYFIAKILHVENYFVC